MIDVTPLDALGAFANDWLDTHHHFSFADYHDPTRMGFGPLRVWNDDRIGPRSGFPMHPHRDMEIITYVREGAITHEDNLGNRGRTEAGDVQVMSAGTGIMHAEMNLEDEDTTLFQIWIMTDAPGHAPRWEARKFPAEPRQGSLVVLASGRPADAADPGALMIHQDAALLGATMAAGAEVVHQLDAGRRAYAVPSRGAIEINGTAVPARAGAAIWGEQRLIIRALEDAEVVVTDLP